MIIFSLNCMCNTFCICISYSRKVIGINFQTAIPFYVPFAQQIQGTWKYDERRNRSSTRKWEAPQEVKWEKNPLGPVFHVVYVFTAGHWYIHHICNCQTSFRLKINYLFIFLLGKKTCEILRPEIQYTLLRWNTP